MARRDRLFYYEFYNPVERNTKFPNLRSFVKRSSPEILREMDMDNENVAHTITQMFKNRAPDTAHSKNILPVPAPVVNYFRYNLNSSRIGGKESRSAEVYVDLSNKNIYRLYRWITRGTRGHPIIPTQRSRIKLNGSPLLAVGWSGGKSYPSSAFWSNEVIHKQYVFVSGWKPNNFVSNIGLDAQLEGFGLIYRRYQRIISEAVPESK